MPFFPPPRSLDHTLCLKSSLGSWLITMDEGQPNVWREAYLGSACLPLDKLKPSGPEKGLDESKVTRLLDIFVLEGCRKFDEIHRLPVLLPKERWESARNELITASPLNSTCPHLNPLTPWTCLRGKHRLAAAYCFLAPSDQWWGVDIYDISSKRQLTAYANLPLTRAQEFRTLS